MTAIDPNQTDRQILLDECIKLTNQKLNQYSSEERKKLSAQDISNYRVLIFELCIKLTGTQDETGLVPSQLELLDLINSVFTYKALHNGHMSIEYFYFMIGCYEQATRYLQQNLSNYLRVTLIPIIPTALPEQATTRIALNRQRLKAIIINYGVRQIDTKHRQMFRDEYTSNPNLTAEQLHPFIVNSAVQDKLNKKIANNLELEVKIILYDTAKHINKNFHQRFFANIIAINAFVKLVATISLEYTKNSVFIVTEPGIFYLFASIIYADIFTNIIQQTFYKTKDFYLRLTLTTVIAATISAPWVALEENIWYRTIMAVSIILTITISDAILILTPWHKDHHDKSRWHLDYFEYERGGPVNPSRIFMAANMPMFMACIYNTFKWLDIDFTNKFYWSGIACGITAAITQLFQTWYFEFKLLPNYSKQTEMNHGLPQYDFFQLYSYMKNYSVRSKQAENIWTISAVILFTEIAYNITQIYPKQYWLPFMLAPIIFLVAPRVATFYQRQIFSRMELPNCIHRSYFEFLEREQNNLGLELSNILSLQKLLQRQSINPLKRLIGIKPIYPLSLSERWQLTESTLQTGKPRITFGERNLIASITVISLYYILMHYLWDKGVTNVLNKHNNLKQGTWSYVLLHIATAVLAHTIIRIGQFIISRVDSLETILFETTGICTRIARTAKTLFYDKTDLSHQTIDESLNSDSRLLIFFKQIFYNRPKAAISTLKENVFIMKKTKNRTVLDSRAAQISQEHLEYRVRTEIPAVVHMRPHSTSRICPAPTTATINTPPMEITHAPVVNPTRYSEPLVTRQYTMNTTRINGHPQLQRIESYWEYHPNPVNTYLYANQRQARSKL